MLIALFILWLIFNGRVTLEIIISGVAVSLALDLLTCKMMGRKFNARSKRAMRRAFGLVRYLVFFVGELIRSSVRVMWLVLHPGEEIDPQLVYFRSGIKNEGLIRSIDEPFFEMEYSAKITLPPMSTVYFEYKKDKKTEQEKTEAEKDEKGIS